MTNIKVRDAVHCLVCGHITFSCNLRRDGDYTVRFSMGRGLTIENEDDAGKVEDATKDEILDLIRQDDSASWPNWSSFLLYWIGQAEGQNRGYESCIRDHGL